MKQRLKKFTEFADRLLPLETSYLLRQATHLEPDRTAILQRLHKRIVEVDEVHDFDLSIDKRKYSRSMRWIEATLHKVDVDRRLEWIGKSHTDILLDQIHPDTDNDILQSIKSMTPQSYYFIRYYDMLTEYRNYLLIRMRYDQYRRVDEVLERWRYNYQKSRLAHDQIHQATADIIGLSDDNKSEAIQWKQWLTNTFDDQSLDGLNRYMAIIRLSFVCLRYNMLPDLYQTMQRLEPFFAGGQYYSRRILMNYYDNMLVLYDKLGDKDKARYYGYLSIRDDHPDTIIYRNNLVNVLLKDSRFKEGLDVIEGTHFKMGSTKNFHSVIGFVANHIRCLSKLDRVPEAMTKGRVFLDAYHKQILTYRWHRFFAAYLGALLMGQRFAEVVRVIERYQLLSREQNHSTHSVKGVQVIEVYYYVALRLAGKLSKDAFRSHLSPIIAKSSAMTLDKELLQMVGEMMQE